MFAMSDPGAEALARHLAAQVQARRLELRLSQAELATLCGTTQSAIARLERGARPPRLDTLTRLADALDCILSVTLAPRTRDRHPPTPSVGEDRA